MIDLLQVKFLSGVTATWGKNSEAFPGLTANSRVLGKNVENLKKNYSEEKALAETAALFVLPCLSVKKYTKLLKRSIQNAGMDVQPVTGVFRILYIWTRKGYTNNPKKLMNRWLFHKNLFIQNDGDQAGFCTWRDYQ